MDSLEKPLRIPLLFLSFFTQLLSFLLILLLLTVDEQQEGYPEMGGSGEGAVEVSSWLHNDAIEASEVRRDKGLEKGTII